MTTVLSTTTLESYVESFNRNDDELYPQHIPNRESVAWMRTDVPRFECPNVDIERTYYFRWWTYRKHIKQTEDGFVITEFLPDVNWSGAHNAISCPAGHHFREGRWLRRNDYLRDYARYWLRGKGSPRDYSFWIADSILAYCQVTGERALAVDLLPELMANYVQWEETHRDANGLFWQIDDRDGMECSISGNRSPDKSGYRATINSYMFGDAMAIARIADWAGDAKLAAQFQEKALTIKRLTETILWDEHARFFKVLPRGEQSVLSDVRELHGYTPWYFNLPDSDKSDAWTQLMDAEGFWAEYGPTTAEQRHPEFAVSYEGHACQWNGPSWPFSTSVTLTAMANLLTDYSQDVISAGDYIKLLETYARSHSLTRDDGLVVPWIDENLNPFTGEWLARSFYKTWQDGDANPALKQERGKDYNHSTFVDHVINGLVGIRPQVDRTLVINPLAPKSWDYWCLDGVDYQGALLTVLFDRTGLRYGKGVGLHVLADGCELASALEPSRLTVSLDGNSESRP